MTTMALVWTRRITVSSVLAVMALLLLSILTVVSSVSLGGLITEQMLGRDGVADSSLILASADNTELSVMGFAPAVSTLPVTNSFLTAGVPTATLRGRVTDMNDMPTSTGYFVWGYASGFMVNTTATQVITATGDYTTDITWPNQNDKIYYEFLADSDGTNRGGVAQFLMPSGVGGFLIKNLLRVVLAAAILIGVVYLGRNGPTVAMLLSAVIGVIAFVIIDRIIISTM